MLSGPVGTGEGVAVRVEDEVVFSGGEKWQVPIGRGPGGLSEEERKVEEARAGNEEVAVDVQELVRLRTGSGVVARVLRVKSR